MARRQRQRNYSALHEENDGPTCNPSSHWHSSEPYDARPGLCVIINNTVFKNNLPLPGGEEDQQRLLVLFTALGFDVKIHKNLTAEQMIHKAESYGAKQHAGVFFCIILSHGTLVDNREAVLGADSKKVKIKQLESFFYASKCPSLHGVPKIFIIDACRGGQQERSINPQSGITTKSARATSTRRASDTPGTDSGHFVTVYASTYGNVAYATSEGSKLTQTFVDVTNEANSNTSFKWIIDEVKERLQTSSSPQTVEYVATSTRRYFIIRDTHVDSIQELQRKFCREVEEWIPIRDETLRKLNETIEKLKVHHRNVNISRITGSTASIAGSTMAIVGFILTPFTLGVSLGLSVPGIALAVAGGSTVAGASMFDILIQRTNVNEVQEQLKHDYDQLSTIYAIAKEIKKIIDEIRQRCEAVGTVEIAKVFGEVVIQGFFRSSNVGIKITELAVFSALEIGAAALRVGGAAARGIAAAGIALNIVLIPIDVIEIVRSSVSIARGSQTRAMKQLNDLVEQLEQQTQVITELLQEQGQATTGGADVHRGLQMTSTC